MRQTLGPDRRAGLSLLNVLLVLASIAVAAGIAIPWFFGRSSVTLENAAQLLVRDVRSAQNRALWIGKDTLVTFDADGGGYRVIDRNGQMVERLGALGDFEQRFEEGGVFAGVHITRIDAGSDRAFVFDAGKKSWEGGEIELTFDDTSLVVRVAARTGQVTIVGRPSHHP